MGGWVGGWVGLTWRRRRRLWGTVLSPSGPSIRRAWATCMTATKRKAESAAVKTLGMGGWVGWMDEEIRQER